MTGLSTSCPQARRVITRRAEQGKWRRSSRWFKMLEEHAHVPGAVCVHCGRHHGQVMIDRKGNIKYDKKGNEKRVNLTINHTARHEYNDEELYLTWNENKEICCTSCNWMYEKGKHPCPDCLKKGIVSYIRWDMQECDTCYYEKHPEILERINQKRGEQASFKKQVSETRNAKNRAAKRDHPCTSRMISGKCKLDGHHCEHSKTKAEKNCMRFQKKKSVKT